MDDRVTEDKSMEIPVRPLPRANLQITTISLTSSSCHLPIIERETLSFTEAYPCVIGSNSAKMQPEKLGIEAQTSDSSIGPANPNGLPSGKKRKKNSWGRETGLRKHNGHRDVFFCLAANFLAGTCLRILCAVTFLPYLGPRGSFSSDLCERSFTYEFASEFF